MKKLLAGIGAIAVALALMPVFAAFEAHIINVTATITNALSVPIESLDFGTVFPQEKFDKTFDVSMSSSFLEDDRFDDIEYLLRQKPKCQLNETGSQVIPALAQFGQATEAYGGTPVSEYFVCKDEVNYDLMPFLCPYLSKAEQTSDGTATEGENDMHEPGHVGALASFHGPIILASELISGWNMDTTKLYELTGRLAKSEQDSADTWNIDFKVPCFGKHCAQDWADFVASNDGDNNANPNEYIQPIENEHRLFGCDLWIEVTEISLPPNTGSVSVFKVVINDNGGTATSSDFTVNVTGVNPIPSSFSGDSEGTLVVLEPGAYSIDESAFAGYSKLLSADCSGTIAAGENKICTITNDDNKASLTVIKHVINDDGGTLNAGNFTMNVTGTNVSDPSFPGEESPGTTVTLDPGAYTVTEDGTNAFAYETALSADCVGIIAAGETKTCTVTNDDKSGTLIVKKVLINNDGGTTATSTFTFQVNGGGATAFEADGQNDLTVDAGSYTINEPDVAGYTTTYNNCTNVDVANGETETCTITNNDNEPILACNAELDLMLVLDRSGSISSGELQTLKLAAHTFVDVLSPSAAGVHIGQSSFSTSATLDQILTGDEAAVHLAINGLATGGSTDLEAGITSATTELGGGNDRTPDADGDFPDAIVVITDGAPNVPNEAQAQADAAAAADTARAAGIEVFVVGVGVTASTETFLITEIADDAAHYFAAADFSELEAKLQELVACENNLGRLTFKDVTLTNDGVDGKPLAQEHDSDVWPWTAATDQNDAEDPPNNGAYDDIKIDDSSRWTSDDPGDGDVMVKRFRFFASTTPVGNIEDIKITWKGQPNSIANATVWVLKTGLSEFTAANWMQLGSLLSIPSDTDRYIVRHIANADVETYVNAATGQIDVMVAIDNDSESLRTDYIQLLVTANP